MRPVRLLHTSDLHLGGLAAPQRGRHRSDCLCSLLGLERAAVRRRADAVVIAGDLFDHQQLRQEFVEEVLTRLARLPMPCLIVNGNHDLHDERSLYRGLVEGGPPSGDEGLIFLDRAGGTPVEILGGRVVIWAKAMVSHDRDFRPLENVPDRPEAEAWWVVVGHGHYEPADEGLLGRSSPLTPDDIEATGADYVALGHWHVRTDVSTASVSAWYSGAPSGVGASGRFNQVDLDPETGTTVTEVKVELPPEGCCALLPTGNRPAVPAG